MTTKSEILKKISENKRKPTSVRMIASQTGLSLDYVRYICEDLLKKNLVLCQGRNLYSISHHQRKGLKSKITAPKRNLSCLKLPFISLAQWKPGRAILRFVSDIAKTTETIKKSPSSSQPKQERLTLSKAFKRAVSFLRKIWQKINFHRIKESLGRGKNANPKNQQPI